MNDLEKRIRLKVLSYHDLSYLEKSPAVSCDEAEFLLKLIDDLRDRLYRQNEVFEKIKYLAQEKGITNE